MTGAPLVQRACCAPSMLPCCLSRRARCPLTLPPLQIVHGKVEDVTLPEKADILISEPMGKDTHTTGWRLGLNRAFQCLALNTCHCGRPWEVQLRLPMAPVVYPTLLAAGTLLVNERMLETYIIARDRFLKPGGKMFPGLGR